MGISDINGQRLYGRDHSVVNEIGNHFKDGPLGDIELIIGIQSVNLKIIVIGSAPAPVEMEEASAVVSIAVEGVPAGIVVTSIIQGNATIQAGDQFVFPSFFGVGVSALYMGTSTVSEILDHCGGN